MEVDRSEGLDDLAQELGLLKRENLRLEVEVLEDVDIRREPIDAVVQVVDESVSVGQQVGERTSSSTCCRTGDRWPW